MPHTKSLGNVRDAYAASGDKDTFIRHSRATADHLATALYTFVSSGEDMAEGRKSEHVDEAETERSEEQKIEGCVEELIAMLRQPGMQGQVCDHVLHSLIAFSQRSMVEAVMQKPPLEMKYYGPTADDLYDLTKELAQKPLVQWTPDDIARSVNRIRPVTAFINTGAHEAKAALAAFHSKWTELVMARPDVRALVDPELVVMDVDCATAFGGFMHGNNYTHVRGFWHVSTAAPPIYY
eukprot:m51a1_g5169 hypothetical protein (237) ;mRNA; f:135479-136663